MSTDRENGFELHPEFGKNPEVAYDRTDLSARGVFVFLIGLAIVGLIIHFTLWGVYRWLARNEVQPTAQPNPMVTSNRELRAVGGDPAVIFPTPRLQPDPVADLNRFRLQEEQWLNNYGWMDPSKTAAHIPIEQAIDQLAKQGLPVRPRPGVQTNANAKTETAPGTGPTGYEPQVKQ